MFGKFLFYSIELCLVFLILTYFSIRIWLIARFDDVVKDRPYTEFVQAINSTPPLPQQLFDAYARVYNFDERKTTNFFLVEIPWRSLSFRYQNTMCPCTRVNYPLVQNPWDRLTIGLALDRDVGSIKCMEYHLNTFDFLHSQIGVRNASSFYFGKELEDLSETEFLTLCIIMKNPSSYDPFRHPDNVRRELLKILHNSQ
ncbi:MAG: transglycosylase domain-containing protein [Flavobacteriales bacterium]|nr:transglycosylase domain-containing protein [Flavobacteriales bacterium]